MFARILLLHAHSFILHELQQVVMNDISAVSAIEGTNSILNFEARKCHGRLFWVSIFASGHRGFFFGWQLKKEAMPAGASCHEVDSRTEAGTRRTALPSVDSGSAFVIHAVFRQQQLAHWILHEFAQPQAILHEFQANCS